MRFSSLTQALRVTAVVTGWLLGQTAIAELKEENPSGESLKTRMFGETLRLVIGIVAAVIYGG